MHILRVWWHPTFFFFLLLWLSSSLSSLLLLSNTHTRCITFLFIARVPFFGWMCFHPLFVHERHEVHWYAHAQSAGRRTNHGKYILVGVYTTSLIIILSLITSIYSCLGEWIDMARIGNPHDALAIIHSPYHASTIFRARK